MQNEHDQKYRKRVGSGSFSGLTKHSTDNSCATRDITQNFSKIPMSSLESRIRLVIVDDDENDRSLTRRIVTQVPGVEFLNSYGSGEEALKGIPGSGADMVLMDIRMAGMGGIECTRRLKAIMPNLTVITMSGLQNEESMEKARSAGADAYLVKPIDKARFLAIFKFTGRNGMPRAPDKSCESSGREPASLDLGSPLTIRQSQVMRLLAKGFLCKEIPEQLGISYSAVHKHQLSSYRKLGAHTRTEALIKLRDRIGSCVGSDTAGQRVPA